MPSLLPAALAPLLTALAALALGPRSLSLGRAAAWLATAGAAASGVLLFASPASSASWVPLHARWIELGVRIDTLSLLLLALVSFVGARVLGFSERYLEGDERQAAFMRRMTLTLAAVQFFVLAPTLFQLALGTVLVSIGLHGLLLHFPDRPGARQAAWTKFIVSRLGDAGLVSAVALTYTGLGTTDLNAVYAAVGSSAVPWTAVAWLVGLAALCKSSQLPFHTWLPETLETPTPVSAFMHAGVVNAGGFLVLRLHPIFEYSTSASSLLALTGAATAAYGALVMLAQTSVKRTLAYSTVAQMGFMILQCGLGAYGLALFHILAHALYKSRAFLLSGSTVFLPSRAAVVLPWRSLLVGAGLAGVLACSLPWTFPGALHEPADRIFVVVILGACAYALARFHAVAGFSGSAWSGFALAFGTFGLAAAVHALASPLFSATSNPLPGWVFGIIAALFISLLVFQFTLARLLLHPWMRLWHVHAGHGFYLGPWVNRQLRRLFRIPAAL